MKMYKAINLIKDEIVVIKEVLLMKGEWEYLDRMSSAESSGS